jgi:hypothetical protein
MSEQTVCEVCNNEKIIWSEEKFDPYALHYVSIGVDCPTCVKESESSEN